jgi:hypothetical protein
MWKGLFWRWKAGWPETRLAMGKSGVMTRVTTMLMEVPARSLRQIG